MIFVDMNVIHFYQPSFVFVKTNVFRPSQSIEEPTFACERQQIKTSASTDLSIGGQEVGMINKNFKGPGDVSDEDDEFLSVEDLLFAIERSWIAEGVDFHNDKGAVSGQMSPFSDDGTFCSSNTIVFFSYDCSSFDQCPPL